MPVPRKNIFDMRDSLDILREAFVGEVAPMRRPRARVASTQELTPPEKIAAEEKKTPVVDAPKRGLSDEDLAGEVTTTEQEAPKVRDLDDPKAWGLEGYIAEKGQETTEHALHKHAQIQEDEMAKATTELIIGRLQQGEAPSKITQELSKMTVRDPKRIGTLQPIIKILEESIPQHPKKTSRLEMPWVQIPMPSEERKTRALNPEELILEKAAEQEPATLDEARTQYVRADMEMRRLSLDKEADPEKLETSVKAAEKSRHQYAEMWRTEKEKLKEPERKVATTQEALRLLDERTQARIERKDVGGENKLERGAHVMGRTALQVGNWYRKQSFKRKIAASVILGGAGLTGAVVGGVFGTAVAGSVLGARIVQRTLGGLGTAGAVEAGIQQWQNKKLEKNVQERIAGELGKLLETIGGNEELDAKLSKIERTETIKRVLRYAAAGAAGYAVFDIANIVHAAGETETGKMAKDAMRGAWDKIEKLIGNVNTPAPIPHPNMEALGNVTELEEQIAHQKAEEAVIFNKSTLLENKIAELEAETPKADATIPLETSPTITPSEIPVSSHPNVLEIAPTTYTNISPTEVMPPKLSVEHLVTEHLAIGKRGPEGTIIDFFKANPDTAKTYGWDGKTKNFSKWVGKRAHQLWLENANEALANNETLAEMKRLGYPATPKGYADMMRHIGKGAVDFDTARGKIGLTDMEYLKAKPLEIAEAPSPVTIAEAPFNPNTFLNTFSDHSVAEQATIAENLKHTSEALEQEIATTADPTLHEMKKSLLMQTQETLAQGERWHALHEQWLVKSGLSEQQLTEVMEKWDVRKFLSVDKKIQSNGQLKGPLEWVLGTHNRSVHELASSLKSKTIDPHLNLKEALKHIITK